MPEVFRLGGSAHAISRTGTCRWASCYRLLVYCEPEATEGERGTMAETVNPGRQHESSGERQTKIVDVLVDAFSELMVADPEAFRQKFRKMAAGPFAFYRESACLFYADMEREHDRWADERI